MACYPHNLLFDSLSPFMRGVPGASPLNTWISVPHTESDVTRMIASLGSVTLGEARVRIARVFVPSHSAASMGV